MSRCNRLMQSGDYVGAVQLFSEAIKSDSENVNLFLGRSTAQCRLEKYVEALGDAEQAIQLKPDCSKVRKCNICTSSIQDLTLDALFASCRGMFVREWRCSVCRNMTKPLTRLKPH